MSETLKDDLVLKALALISERCPRLVKHCYWAGTSSISIEVLHHRQSFDLDFHTRKAHENTTPILMELQTAFANDFHVLQVPDEYGSGFQGLLSLPGGEEITLEVLSNYEDVSDRDVTATTRIPGFTRVTLARYLADKIQCVAERSEARDLVDIMAVIRHAPQLKEEAKAILESQDAIIVSERLMAWTNEEISDDLAAYNDVDPAQAQQGRDLLLNWLKGAHRESDGPS
jgi:Nucleotidyl transferase AbiEii toxin, Type IV TA system